MRERKNMFAMDRNDVRTNLTGTLILCLIYSLGMLLSLFQLVPFRTGNRIFLWLVSWAILLAGYGFGWFAKQYRKWAVLFPAGGAVLGILYFGPARMLAGLQAFENVLITGWNLRWEDGIPLLGDGQMTEEALFAFSLCLLLLLISVFWYLAARRACIRILFLLILCLTPEIVLRYSSSFGSVLLLACAAGSWLLFFQAGSRARRLQWLAVLGAALVLAAAVSGRRQLLSVLELQKGTVQAVSRIRYGEDLLPEGDLTEAWQMQNGTGNTLLVSTEQIKPLYLRGFVGAEYQDAGWSGLSRAAYGRERWGFLDWLKRNAFDANAQYAAYEAASGDDQDGLVAGYVPENHITIENNGANRKYIYTVYAAAAPQGSQITSSRDHGYRSKALFGNWKYTYSEWSADVPGELIQPGGWVYQPDTMEQEQYLQGEMVYRDFVYEHYLDIPEKLETGIFRLFHDGVEPETVRNGQALAEKGIYGITQDIRTVMEDRFFYRAVPESYGTEDPLPAFLDGQIYGNSAFYASAGVLALRSFGIPARYAEGYYLSKDAIERNGSGQVQLTGKDAHAWTEAYMDGIGWIPVDFTPGFYYNTYALLRMAELPQNIRKTAALENQGDEAENVTGNTPQDGNREDDTLQEKALREDFAWGLLLVVLFILEVLLVLLELSRWHYEKRIRRPLKSAPETEAEFLAFAIADNLQACGMDIRPGWKTAETEGEIRSRFPDVPEGVYRRVNEILERYLYGGAALKPHELRLLQNFLITLRESRNLLELKQRIRFRYPVLRHGKPASRHSNQA